MQNTAQTAVRNGMVENQRYDAMLRAPVPTPPRESAKTAAGEATTTLPAEPMHRDKLTLADVMGHSVVQPFRHATSLGKPTRSPSYLPSSVFSRTLVDLLTPGSTEPTLADIEAGVRALENSPKLQQSLSSIIKATKGEVDSFISSTQVWFDRQMDPVIGSYKRWAKRWVLVLAVALVCIGNIDSIAIARALYAGGAIRATVIQQVTDLNFCSTPGDQTKCAEEAASFLTQSVIPLGWSAHNPQDGLWGWPLKVLGLLISVGAAGWAHPSGITCWIGSDPCVIPDVHQNLVPDRGTRGGVRTSERGAHLDSASMTFYLAQGKGLPCCRHPVISVQ
jgi:hypothetical protein